MKIFFKITLPAFMLIFTSGCSFSQTGNSGTSQMPISREAVFVESYSPSEVTVKAKGIGKDVDWAESDAKKSAVYFVLFLANNPLLQTQAEKNSFETIQESFFANQNVNNYITFVSSEILSRVKTADGLKVEKLIRVNKQRLTEDLVERGIIISREELAENVGTPFIMVVPETQKGENPIDLLRSNSNVKKGAEVIESYLTSRQYDVQVPEQSENLNNLIGAQTGIKGIEDDIAYQLALTVGSDVYITYNVAVEKGKLGNKGVVGCRAYETTTARLLGTETGYSPERPSAPDAALIEEAMNDAIDRVLSRITAYWKTDAQNGRQYKVIFKLTGSFSDPYLISDAIDDVLREVTTKRKQNVATEQTVDYIVWQNKYENANRMFRDISKKLEEHPDFTDEGAVAKRLSVNRKLLIIGIEN